MYYSNGGRFVRREIIFLNNYLASKETIHGRVVKGVGHLGHDEAMEAGGREFDPQPGHYSRMSF